MYRKIFITIILCLISFKANAYADRFNVCNVIRAACIMDNSNTSTYTIIKIKNNNEQSWLVAVTEGLKQVAGRVFGEGTVNTEILYQDKDALEEMIQNLTELEKLLTIQSDEDELDLVRKLRRGCTQLLEITEIIIKDPDHKQMRVPE